MQDDLVLQQPSQPQQLLLLFHGVGSKASDLAPLGRTLAPHMPYALVASVQDAIVVRLRDVQSRAD